MRLISMSTIIRPHIRLRLHSNGTVSIRHNFITFHSRLHSDGLNLYRYALAFTLYRSEGHFIAWACAMKFSVYIWRYVKESKMAANKACKKKSDENKSSKRFSWTDEETSLLLQVVKVYKASKTATGLDWETVKTDMKISQREISGPVSPI